MQTSGCNKRNCWIDLQVNEFMCSETECLIGFIPKAARYNCSLTVGCRSTFHPGVFSKYPAGFCSWLFPFFATKQKTASLYHFPRHTDHGRPSLFLCRGEWGALPNLGQREEAGAFPLGWGERRIGAFLPAFLSGPYWLVLSLGEGLQLDWTFIHEGQGPNVIYGLSQLAATILT